MSLVLVNWLGRIINFHQVLNLVYGLNEAGKSTLQRSIFALLYGFFEDGSIKASMRVDLTNFNLGTKMPNMLECFLTN